MTILLAASVSQQLGAALREAFFMFWETLWALVLGFGLSGAVQAFVSRDEMQRLLGDHRPKALLRATGFGAASSSCSYAAAAMAKSLFQKGADFLSAMVFMFASTNLVVELGIVLLILMGWQFAAAEFVGGPIMIVLLVLAGSLVVRKGLIRQARGQLVHATDELAVGGGHETSMEADGDAALQSLPWVVKLRSKAGWCDAASYTMADLRMLRKELVVGYLVAGLLAVLVPMGAWNAVFLRGHGFWTSVENVLVGPFIALISFVCSVGNVPMAAALWHGGISFGGVVSFVFADLISAPLLLIYRKYYGTRLTLRLLGLFWAVMSAAGLIVEGLFAALHLVPATRPAQIVPLGFHWNYTTFLNVALLALFALLWWLARNRERLGGGRGYAIDPVCGMQVQTANAPTSVEHARRTVFFCSDHCRERFLGDPERHLTGKALPGRQRDMDSGGQPAARPQEAGGAEPSPDEGVDPVCGMTVDRASAAARRPYRGVTYVFCSIGCAEAFDDDPTRFAPEPSAPTH